MSKVISRQEARAKGLKRYYTGKPCNKGHVDERLVSNFCCVACHRNKVNNYYDKNPDKKRKYLKEWNKKNPGCSQRWIKNNPSKALEVKKKSTKRWRSNNKEKYACSWRNYHSRKKGAKGSHTGEDILRLLNKQQKKCAAPHCRIILHNFHVDHKKPLIKGGSNYPRNLQLLCASCNGSKGPKTMKEWLRSKMAS